MTFINYYLYVDFPTLHSFDSNNRTSPLMTQLTPREIVSELDRFIIGQEEAKKAVAIALRNRWRRQNVSPESLREEIVPKNILMIGPTGCGKTEISRRLARLADAPFAKVEATKFTEVGYVGRDVDSIIRDLTEVSLGMTREKMREEVQAKAELAAEDRLLDVLVGKSAAAETRRAFREKLRAGELDEKEIEIEVEDTASAFPTFDIPGMPGAQMGMMNIGDMLGKAMGGRTKRRKMSVGEAKRAVLAEESDKLLDEDQVTQKAIEAVEQQGIVFIDEIDKVSVRSELRGGDVSREGVQRDLLPLLEGTTVSTKYGPVKTDHILFIASGAFHMAKPSDLLPELQGRLPIRVELAPLSEGDMQRILSEPETSLIRQYIALMETEEIEVSITDDAVSALAGLATTINRNVENIGARRLHTLMEKLFEEISFTAPDQSGQSLVIDEAYVRDKLGGLTDKMDLSKFIL